jgi:hypothetical protein
MIPTMPYQVSLCNTLLKKHKRDIYSLLQCHSGGLGPAFCQGDRVVPEALVRGQRGAFLVHSEFSLEDVAEQKWIIVGEVDQTHEKVSRLQASRAGSRERGGGQVLG